jgi:hypothetical protein
MRTLRGFNSNETSAAFRMPRFAQDAGVVVNENRKFNWFKRVTYVIIIELKI